MTLPELDAEELSRYSRHLLMPEVGLDGQRRLKAAKVLVVGTGGLGSPAALYLAAAGVGTLGLVDFDVVEASNLQRQIVHGTSQLGRAKVLSAQDRLRDLNPRIIVVPHEERFQASNALELCGAYDVIVDGTDNFATRYLINDACVLLGKPLVFGSILRTEGQASVFWAARGPCYRCLYPEPPAEGVVPSCAQAGVLGVLPGIVGSIQAAEAIKLIVGSGESLVGRLLLFHAWNLRFQEVALAKDPHCPICGEHPSITHLTEAAALCETPSVNSMAPAEISAPELLALLESGMCPQLIDVREPAEFALSQIPGALSLPLSRWEQSRAALDPAREAIVICHLGVRSLRAIELLRGQGYAGGLRNLTGGMAAWESAVHPLLGSQ